MDLGGTKIVVALVRSTGEIVAREIIRDHRGRSEDEIVAMIAQAVRSLVPIGQLAGIGVGTTGHVDFSKGVVISSANLPGFDNYPLARRMSEELETEVVVDNDANAQSYAEYRFGAGRGFDNVLFVTVSTGLGAGIIIDGKLYRGVTGTAGEIGHTIVNPAGRIRCGCGNYGCLMAHASGLTLPDVVRDRLRESGARTSMDFAALDDDEITGELVKSGLDSGDELCTEVVLEYAHYLGVGLHNVVQTLNPGVIVLGGGLTAWGRLYMDRVRETFHGLAARTINEPPEIRLSELGADAAVVGAAALVMTTGEESP
ncbi:MAG: ROK family protein [Spirochaetia bacterium]